ncbi:MAG: NAD(P)-binding domain-containing protein [Acidobacteriota bacterium]|nr:NAD(P)-binding domain-containing protein [Acidobacteriota bacterium]
MENRTNHLLVIGAGPTGLVVARALKQAGIPYDQVDADEDVGGNWRHGVYETVHIISSRKTTSFPEYPMPAHYPDFPSRAQMLAYLCDYARHFALRANIEFRREVSLATPLEDWSWRVQFTDGTERRYKGVVVCNGHHWDRRFPDYPGQFTGEWIHSKDYKRPEQLVGKRVLVIGGGNSACDIASEAARVAVCSHLSLRRGYWFLPKTMLGIPTVEIMRGWLPVPAQRALLRLLLRVIVGRYAQYGLPEPDHKIFERHPTVNSELLYYLKHGRIRPRPDVARFNGRTVHFVDGAADEYDLVVCATGFYVSFPFLPPGLVTVKGSTAQLYAGVIPPRTRNLYIFGTTQPRYGFGPLASPAADLLARLIRLQDEMVLPLSVVFEASGAQLPTTHLVDPHAALRRMRMAQWFLPFLAWRERRLRKRPEIVALPLWTPSSA